MATVLDRLAAEIADARRADPTLQTALGPRIRFLRPQAARAWHPPGWRRLGRAWPDVWRSANRLNRLVVDALTRRRPSCHLVPTLGLGPGPRRRDRRAGGRPDSSGRSSPGCFPCPGRRRLRRGHRDDDPVHRERVFAFLAPRLTPRRLLLAGIDRGVYLDFPRNTQSLEVLAELDLDGCRSQGSSATDVTGGMADKVRHALALARAVPGLEVRIFSGEDPGSVARGAARRHTRVAPRGVAPPRPNPRSRPLRGRMALAAPLPPS